MKKLFVISLLLFVFSNMLAQQRKIDSLRMAYKSETIDSLKLKKLKKYLKNYMLLNKDSLLQAAIQYKNLLKKFNKEYELAQAYLYMSEAFLEKNNFKKAKLYAEKGLNISKNKNHYNSKVFLIAVNQLGRIYDNFKKYKKALRTYHMADTVKINKNNAGYLINVSSI